MNMYITHRQQWTPKQGLNIGRKQVSDADTWSLNFTVSHTLQLQTPNVTLIYMTKLLIMFLFYIILTRRQNVGVFIVKNHNIPQGSVITQRTCFWNIPFCIRFALTLFEMTIWNDKCETQFPPYCNNSNAKPFLHLSWYWTCESLVAYIPLSLQWPHYGKTLNIRARTKRTNT